MIQLPQALMGPVRPIASFMSLLFTVFVVLIVIPYVRQRPRPPGNAADFDWHLFVPCRDEETVIGDTIRHLLGTFPQAHIWVVDDACEDATTSEVDLASGGDERVHLVSRRLPDARKGKGEALNAAYRALGRWLPATHDRTRVIVGVIDADGRPAPNCLDVCAAGHLFGDPGVGAVQVGVRMINRADPRPVPGRGRLVSAFCRTLVRMQDLEFRAAISAIQLLRRYTGTVALGGNGQFTRLSALDAVCREYGQPWHGSLLEDYELSIHLMLIGHRNEFAPETVVDQEGLPGLRRLIAQRTRWAQGMMQCGRYLPRLWRCPHVPRRGAMEATYCLLTPWVQLAGTFLYPIPLALLAYHAARHPEHALGWVVGGGWLLLGFFLLFGMGPFIIWGPLYARYARHHESPIGRWRAIGYGLAYTAYIFLFYVTAWRAFFRLVRGRSTWAKTRRNAETSFGPISIET